MKKILFNASTNVVGGGVKNAAFFIKKAVNTNEFDWYFAISPQVLEILITWGLDTSDKRFILFNLSPARSKFSRKIILDLISKYGIEMVYTMAGPAYVKFPCKHLQGLSNPYITHADWSSFKLKGSIFLIIKYYSYVAIQFYYARNADYFVFQTEFSKNSFQRRSKVNKSRLYVVPNAFDKSLREHFSSRADFDISAEKSEFTIFCPGAAYIHKGFQFLPNIINELNKITNKSFKFILTLPANSELWLKIQNQLEKLNLLHTVDNIGPFNYASIKTLLANSDIVFVPSLLETFSASYLEAMCARKKLVVADKMYAKDICGEYADYIDPEDSSKTAVVFKKLFENFELTEEEVVLGNKILDSYGSQDDRFEKLIDLITNILKK